MNTETKIINKLFTRLTGIETKSFANSLPEDLDYTSVVGWACLELMNTSDEFITNNLPDISEEGRRAIWRNVYQQFNVLLYS